MRCLFCKNDTVDSVSVEHVIPESLGNTTLILPIGYVCDKCNNYFSRKVENHFLNLPEIKLLRFEQGIENKKKKVPIATGVFDHHSEVHLIKKFSKGKRDFSIIAPPNVLSNLIESKNTNHTIVIKAYDDTPLLKSNKIISRLVAKIALEALDHKLMSMKDAHEFLVDDIAFDDLRNHAKIGIIDEWPISIRRVYNIDKDWNINGKQITQIIHECDFLLPSEQNMQEDGAVISEIYFIFILFGLEFVINMGGPEIEGYKKWLKENKYISPLHTSKYKSCVENH